MSFLKNFFNQNINRDLDSLRKRWTRSISNIALIVYLIITLTEIAVFFLFKATGKENFNEQFYLRHFFLFPLIINGIIVTLMYRAVKSSMKDGTKSYLMSFLFVMLIFVMNIVHSVFPVILITFAVPVLLSVIYSDKRLTNTTAVFALILEIIAEFFIVWDGDKPLPFESADNFATILVSFMTQIGLFIISQQILKFEIIKLKLTKDFEIERYHLMEEAMRDGLTGINNRKAFDKNLEDISKNKLPEDTFVFAMIDLDNFKKINDNFGHQEGDKALIIAAEIILTEAKKYNGNAFRYGGDEFVIIFRNEKYNDIFKTCLKIKALYEKSLTRQMKEVNSSMSFGLSECRGDEDLNDQISIADEQMYAFKKNKKIRD